MTGNHKARLAKLEKEVAKRKAIREALPTHSMPSDDLGPGEETMCEELPIETVPDARPDPKPRKYPQLWQAYLWWFELMEMRKRHLLRISSIQRGKSNLDDQFEIDMLAQTALDAQLKNVKKVMTNYGKLVPVWDWVTSIRGMGEGGMAAQLLAQIDDIDKCPTVASLWRFVALP